MGFPYPDNAPYVSIGFMMIVRRLWPLGRDPRCTARFGGIVYTFLTPFSRYWFDHISIIKSILRPYCSFLVYYIISKIIYHWLYFCINKEKCGKTKMITFNYCIPNLPGKGNSCGLELNLWKALVADTFSAILIPSVNVCISSLCVK